MAQALAARIVKEGPSAESERIGLAFRLCLSRTPTPAEKQRLGELFRKELASLKQTPDEAAALAGKKADPENRPRSTRCVDDRVPGIAQPR